MGLDIANKLFPQVLTVVVQLCATGVIYLMYRKFLHLPVQNYLEKRADLIARELSDAVALKKESEALKEQAQQEMMAEKERLAMVETQMIQDAKRKSNELIDAAKASIRQQQDTLQKQYEEDKKQLISDVSDHVLDVAVAVNKKVLSATHFESESLLEDLEKEMKRHDRY